MLLLTFLLACGGGSAPADCPKVPSVAVAPSGGAAGQSLSDFEYNLLKNDLEDLRKGIRPYNNEGWGICATRSRGGKDCERYLGTEPGELAAGEYMILADLAVPKLGEGWKVEYSQECQTTKVSGSSTTTSTSSDSKTYDVRYSGVDRGYRLAPLRSISSPSTSGARACSFTLTPIAPDGSRGEGLSGSYSTPAK